MKGLEVTERQLQAQVLDLLAQAGFRLRYHTHDSRRSAAGYPDVCAVRERIVFLELKTRLGKLSAAQKDWLDGLLAAQTEAYLIRPADLDALALVLTARRRPDGIWHKGTHQASVDACFELYMATRKAVAA